MRKLGYFVVRLWFFCIGWVALAVVDSGSWTGIALVLLGMMSICVGGFYSLLLLPARTAPRALRRELFDFTASISEYLAGWSVVYFLLVARDSAAFSEKLGRLDAAYFTLTTFSTTGFGDLAPRSHAARVAVTLNIVGNLLVLGVAVTLMLAVLAGRLVRSTADAD